MDGIYSFERMENELDKIAEGKEDNVEFEREFYNKLIPLIDNANKHMEKIEPEKIGEQQERNHQHAEPEQHLRAARALDVTDQRIDPGVQDQDLHRVVETYL